MAAPLAPEVLGQRYRLSQALGEGAGGAVYSAQDLSLGRTVAIKRMKPIAGAALADRAAEFAREARTLAKLRHPHIVAIHDVGIDEVGQPYFVMELVEETLAHVLVSDARLAVEDLVAMILPLCGALACAHDLGIIHCDLKPENIAIRRTGGGHLRAKLLDFGIAMAHEASVERDFVLGTPGYMAPEQLRGEHCDARTDVWALGVVACKCVTGRSPYDADTPHELLERTAYGAPDSLRAMMPELPVSVALALDRAVAPAPAHRYRDMRDFARALAIAATQAGLPVPSDPEPLGLPDYARWLREQVGHTELLSARPASEPPPSAPLVVPQPPQPTRAGPVVHARDSKLAPWLLLPAALLVALVGIWLRYGLGSTTGPAALPVPEPIDFEVAPRSPELEARQVSSPPLKAAAPAPDPQHASERSGEASSPASPSTPSTPSTAAPRPVEVPSHASTSGRRRRPMRESDRGKPAQPPVAQPSGEPERASQLELKRDWNW